MGPYNSLFGGVRREGGKKEESEFILHLQNPNVGIGSREEEMAGGIFRSK